MIDKEFNLIQTMLKAGRKTNRWNRVRAQLKKQFAAKGITRCELCFTDWNLSFAHSLKRRFITTDEQLKEVALLCIPCHEQIEHSANMTEQIRAIISNRELDRVGSQTR